MLVLSRKKNEKLVIGDNIVITIVEVRGNNVRIGIEAPLDVKVLRGEISPDQPKVIDLQVTDSDRQMMGRAKRA